MALKKKNYTIYSATFVDLDLDLRRRHPSTKVVAGREPTHPSRPNF